MKDFYFKLLLFLYLTVAFASLSNSLVTESKFNETEKEQIRMLNDRSKDMDKKLVKKKGNDPSQLGANFMVPDFSQRLKRMPLLRRMKKAINRFNRQADSEEAMEHLGQDGTFFWLQGMQPIFVFGPDCFSRIVKENKNEVDHHFTFFSLFLRHILRRFYGSRRLKLHAQRSKKLLKNRLKEIKQSFNELKSKLKIRVLSENSVGTKNKHWFHKNIQHKKKAILNFLNIKKKRRLMGLPPVVVPNIDDSYIHIHSFARPPEQQSNLVKDMADFKETKVVQVRVKVPTKLYKETTENQKTKI